MPDDLPQRDNPRPAGERQLADELRAARRELDVRVRQLERAEARFRDVIEKNADAILVVDRTGTIRFANEMASRVFGKRRDQLLGSMLGFPVVDGETTEVDLFVKGLARVAEMRVVLSEWEGEVAYIASLRDVTERKRAEQDARRLIREQTARVAAEESAHRMRFLLDTSTILSASLDYNATLSSLARLCVPRMADWTVVYGVDSDGVPHRLDVAHHIESKGALTRELKKIPISREGAHPVLEVIRTRRPQLVEAVTDLQLAAMTASERELEIARSLGVSSYMLVPMVARDHALGAIAFVSSNPERRFTAGDLTLAEDVARRAALAVDNANLYREAQHANQTKSDFLAVVSHDLRTPLTAIIGYSELLEMGVPEPISDGARERVNRIRTSAKHLLYLLNELLTFARLDSGKESVRATEIDTRDILHEISQVIEPLTQSRGLGFAVEVPEDPVRLNTDADKLRQILLNLAGNAVKYTKSGKVAMKVHRVDGEVRFEVRDTGDGIAPQHLAQIFEPFWQVDPSQRQHGGGTGLGLSVVKRLANLLGGTVSVESKPAEGSTFCVAFPG